MKTCPTCPIVINLEFETYCPIAYMNLLFWFNILMDYFIKDNNNFSFVDFRISGWVIFWKSNSVATCLQWWYGVWSGTLNQKSNFVLSLEFKWFGSPQFHKSFLAASFVCNTWLWYYLFSGNISWLVYFKWWWKN